MTSVCSCTTPTPSRKAKNVISHVRLLFVEHESSSTVEISDQGNECMILPRVKRLAHEQRKQVPTNGAKNRREAGLGGIRREKRPHGPAANVYFSSLKRAERGFSMRFSSSKDRQAKIFLLERICRLAGARRGVVRLNPLR